MLEGEFFVLKQMLIRLLVHTKTESQMRAVICCVFVWYTFYLIWIWYFQQKEGLKAYSDSRICIIDENVQNAVVLFLHSCEELLNFFHFTVVDIRSDALASSLCYLLKH